jgi:hypothetical protein
MIRKPSCKAGSIEQQLDMCETGRLRGDEITHSHGHPHTEDDYKEATAVDREMDNYNVTMSERNREGSEMSGDDHAMGFQGDDAGLPGEEANENLPEAEPTQDLVLEIKHRFKRKKR